MSQQFNNNFVERVIHTQLWDILSEDEKNNVMDWGPIATQLIRENMPGANPEEVIDSMNTLEFGSFFDIVMRRYRRRQQKIEAMLSGETEDESDDEDEAIGEAHEEVDDGQEEESNEGS